MVGGNCSCKLSKIPMGLFYVCKQCNWGIGISLSINVYFAMRKATLLYEIVTLFYTPFSEDEIKFRI